MPRRPRPRHPVERSELDDDTLFYVAPSSQEHLRLATELQSALSPICRVAVSGNGDSTTTPANMQQACDVLKKLNQNWSCVLRPDDGELKFFLAVRNQVLHLVVLGHPCIQMLLTAHAWALRASMPSSINNTDSVCSLLTELQLAIRAIWKGKPCDPIDEPLMRIWETVVTAFLRTQPLQAASAVLHAHRQRLVACRGDAVPELAALRQAADAWTGALELAELVGNLEFKKVSAAISNPLADVATSHIVQHLCALRLDLAEALARAVEEGQGEGEEAGGGDAATAEAARQLSERHEQDDASLLELVASIAHSCSAGGVVAKQRDLTVCVEVDTRQPGGSDAELRSALSHPAVQCLLGWWLVAPGAAAGGGGGRAWGLPGPLLRHMEAIGERDKLCVRALKGAALCWEQVLRDWEGSNSDPAAPPSALVPSGAAGTAAAGAGSGAATAGATGLGCGSGFGPGEAARQQQPTGAAGAGQVPQTTADGPVAAAVAGTPSGTSRPVYSPAHMHRMCMAGLRQCCSFPEYAPGMAMDAYFEILSLRPAVDKGLGVLIGNLLRMPPAKAARRLASVWRLLLRVSKAGFGMLCSTLGLRMGQLLGELLPHLQQQQEQQHGGSRTAPAGELPGAVQGDLEVAAGGVASGSGEGAAGPGKHFAPSCYCMSVSNCKYCCCGEVVNCNWWNNLGSTNPVGCNQG